MMPTITSASITAPSTPTENGTIDLSEGRLIAFGGIDSTTGLPLEVPFMAPLGQMLTRSRPFTPWAIDSGLNDDDASNWIDQAFALRGFDYLRKILCCG
jgi:hypothetical protein